MKKNLRPLIIVLCLLATPLGLSAQSLVFHLTGGGKTIVDLPAEFTLTPDGNQLTIAIGGGQNVTLSKGDVMCVTYRESRGDVNGDQRVSVADVATLVGMLLGSSSSSGNAPANVEAVDLGLPSGTLWANMNVGASRPEDYGGYYAWGETEEKEVYSRDTYIYAEPNAINTDISGTQYDVAHVKWGGDWRMPTNADIQELFANCSTEWATVNGVNGRKFTGSNGNFIFLPANGAHYFSAYDGYGSNGYYWSSTPYDKDDANDIFFSEYSDKNLKSYARHYGISVRPVRNSQ